MKHFPSPFTVMLIAAAVLWLYGFLFFVADINTLSLAEAPPEVEKTDAIVVLTGGSERVGKGVELLEAGAAKKLLISGVHKGITLDGVLGAQQIPPDLRSCCIILGFHAGSTVGNAQETRGWMEKEGYTSLRLVTANYHMPRSLLLFRSAMPDVTIIAHPVSPDSVKLAEWWQHPGTVELLATEYIKLLLANVKIWINQE